MKKPQDRQSGEVPQHSLDVERLGEVFTYLLSGDGKANLEKSSWEFSFVRAMFQTWKRDGPAGITRDGLIRLEKIYCRC